MIYILLVLVRDQKKLFTKWTICSSFFTSFDQSSRRYIVSLYYFFCCFVLMFVLMYYFFYKRFGICSSCTNRGECAMAGVAKHPLTSFSSVSIFDNLIAMAFDAFHLCIFLIKLFYLCWCFLFKKKDISS